MDSTFPLGLAPNDEPPADFFIWGAPPPPKIPSTQDGDGLSCETANFDSFYGDHGERLVLPAGQRYKGRQNHGVKSALSVTTHWDHHQDFLYIVLDIRSPHMKAAMKATVPEYSSYNIGTKHISITGSPWCLYHYRQELGEYGEELMKRDYEAGKHVYHLLSYMWETFSKEIITLGVWVDNIDSADWPALDHKHLWMLYRPGDIVYVRERRLAFVFKNMTLTSKDWKLTGSHIDFDGSEYGSRYIDITIKAYDGFKLLRELTGAPFSRLPESEQVTLRKELLARGRKFIGLHGNQYLWYDGKCKLWPSYTGTMVKSRIVIDHTSYKTHCVGPVYLKDGTPKYNTDSVQASITEDDLMMCNKDVMGYCLKDNKWAVFDIDSISNISFDTEAFDALMFPKEQKRQILSLVRVHEDERLIFDDFVKGKGRGMVFLLYGDPGTGKTLTAESISDYCKKPLLRLDASTLGTSVDSVETGLTRAFNLAEKWQALVLIDEADIYLEQRKSKNLTHNGLVSVFLRTLEYYQGILFLTTNRINSFDRAFMSRIHLPLHYPPLNHHSRRKLWYLFLKRASPESAEALLQTGAIDKFAEEILNGREIKNVREEEAKRNHHHREESVAVEDKQHELDDGDDDDDEADDFDAPLVKRRRLGL
ncbi:P-loop containing nucleoside triphosphate hydrolase protein [Rhypophila decipiens]|uniref:P-loop containing nucleoside triphosphate hydrolase protein n=1 Tax=Rhypophila decipiens TaxID=261697 RepID=A0AAN6Y7I2_9PEZI|nr:P-loop containing nucleoside triphosphate hydrolase protein [Rhypophila decipiens]